MSKCIRCGSQKFTLKDGWVKCTHCNLSYPCGGELLPSPAEDTPKKATFKAKFKKKHNSQ